jgi:hypothetical protein
VCALCTYVQYVAKHSIRSMTLLSRYDTVHMYVDCLYSTYCTYWHLFRGQDES